MPNSPRAKPSKPKKFHTKQWRDVVAAGRLKRALVLFSYQQNRLKLEYAQDGDTILPAGNYLTCERVSGNKCVVGYEPPTDAGQMLSAVVLDGYRALLTDNAGRLFSLFCNGGSAADCIGTAEIMGFDTLALAHLPDGALYITREQADGSYWLVAFRERRWVKEKQGYYDPSQRLRLTGEMRRAFIGYGKVCSHKDFGLVALTQDDCHWEVYTHSGFLKFRPPGDVQVVGVAETIPYCKVGLIVLEDGGRRLAWHGQEAREVLVTSATPIVTATVSPTMPHIAYLTAAGDLGVYSLRYKTEVCRYTATSP